MTSLYSDKDIDTLRDGWTEIMQQVEKERTQIFGPSLDEMKAIQKIITNFVKKNKRKIYGGFALNMMVEDKDKNDAFYGDDKVADVDFYSFEPIIDVMKLCNELHAAGYKSVMGREAMHQETYSIEVNRVVYCDLTYVPRNVYNRMPYKEIGGFMCIHPYFMTIDYLRMFTDPLLSYWRMDDLKAFKRFFLLQKHYPLPHNEKPLEISGSTPALDVVLDVVQKFLEHRQSTIVIGFYAYDQFLKGSGILDDKSNAKFGYVQPPYYEFISTNYRQDCLDLIAALKDIININKADIKHKEFYPFFQFTGYNTEIWLGKDLVARVFSHGKKCYPYLTVEACRFGDKSVNVGSGSKTIQIGTFAVTLLGFLINVMRARTNGDKDTMDLYYVMSSHIVEMRDYFFRNNGKSILDDTMFKDFIVRCVGETITPEMQRKLLIDERKRKNKRYTFRYDPEDGVKTPDSDYQFLNSSGNEINNVKNLKLANVVREDHEDDGEE